jgi:hypothetical protein
MEYAENEGRDWRRHLQEWLEKELESTVFNPNTESRIFLDTSYPGIDFRATKQEHPDRYREIVAQLVALDCREIAEHTDFVICYWDQGASRGAGTKGELTLARFFGKPVYLVTAFAFPEIPGWVIGCTDRMFPDFDALKRFLLDPASEPRRATPAAKTSRH